MMTNTMVNDLMGIHCRVFGHVQGVGFRYSTIIQGKHHRVNGYVKNLSDGTVEVVAEGEKENLQALLAWLKKGPPGSFVSNVDFRYTPYSGVYRTFSLEY